MVLGSMNFFQPGAKAWIARIPMRHVATVNSRWRDLWVLCCFGFVLLKILVRFRFGFPQERLNCFAARPNYPSLD